MSDPPDWYGAHVEEASARFEALLPDEVHGWLVDFLPAGADAVVMDVGAGSGRDAAWLARKGYRVIAAEPSARMRETARVLHPDPAISWIADSLPALATVGRLGLSFDLILLSAVWMHVAPGERARAFRKLVTLLKAGGRLAFSLRLGPPDAERSLHPVDLAEIESLARAHGALVEAVSHSADLTGRDGVAWTNVVLRLPDDGTGALPLLRHIILNDAKTATYKVALLRALARIADGAGGLAREGEDRLVAVPLGLVALYWLRLFKPLLAAGLPQLVGNVGDRGLGFVKAPFRALADLSPLDLRVGAAFEDERARILHAALADAADTISRMPATFTTFADGAPVFPTVRGPRTDAWAPRLTADYLWSFGVMKAPGPLWRALGRFDVWIEPALIAEWTALMKRFAASQGRTLDGETIARALAWSDPARDVAEARRWALARLEQGALHCVWSGRRLSAETQDIDHCFPWAAWPCDALWNLMPAHREVNQREKRDRLPAPGRLREAQDRIQGWWDAAYLRGAGAPTAERFLIEAQATLPLLTPAPPALGEVFEAVTIQQARLRADQGVQVW